jgi:iron complex outermembrane receptor protein
MGNDNLVAGRLLIRADPTPTVNILLSADYNRERSSGANTVVAYTTITADAPATSSGPNSPTGLIGAIATELGLNPGTPTAPNQTNLAIARQTYLSYISQYLNGNKFYNSFGTGAPESDYKVYGFSGQISKKIGNLELKSITAWRHVDQEPRIDYDGTPFTLLYTYTPTRDHNFSQEVQVNDIDQHGLDWQVGAFFNREFGNEFSDNNTNAAVSSARAQVSDTDSLNKSLAGYGQATYYITHRLRVTAGVRYTHDYRGVISHNRFDPTLAIAPFPAAGISPGVCTLLSPAKGGPVYPNCNYATHTTFNRATYLASIDYRPVDNVMIYASTARGYRAGGYTAQASSSVSQSQAQLDAFFTPFAPETVTNYELGFKSDLLNRKLRVNGAFYYQNYNDVQVQIRDLVAAPDGSQFQVTLIRNAAKARLFGGELSVDAAPSQRLRFDASMAYLNAKYTRFFARDASGNLLDLSSQPFAAPKWTFNLGGSYTLPIDNGNVRLSLNYAYQSKVYFRADTPHLDATAQSKYGLLDGRLNWHINSLNLDLAIWGKNLTNKRYLLSATNLEASGYDVGFPGDPRTFGGQVRKTF